MQIRFKREIRVVVREASVKAIRNENFKILEMKFRIEDNSSEEK